MNIHNINSIKMIKFKKVKVNSQNLFLIINE